MLDKNDKDKEAIANPEVLAKLTICLAMYSNISILTVI